MGNFGWGILAGLVLSLLIGEIRQAVYMRKLRKIQEQFGRFHDGG